MSRAAELLEAIEKRHASSPQERTFLAPVLKDCLDAMRGIEQESDRHVRKAKKDLEHFHRVAEANGYWEAHQEGAKAGEEKARREMREEIDRANRLRLKIRDTVARLMVHSGELQGILWIIRELDVISREDS